MLLLNGTLVIAAYYASWSIYSRNYEASQLPFKNLTHINYAFASVQSDGQVFLTDLWADTQRPVVRRQALGGLFGNLGALYEFKQEHPGLKIGLSIGGWGGSGGFSAAVSTNQTRSTFVKTALNYILDLGLDYIDLDWEYPVSGGPEDQMHNIEDGRNYVLLLQDFRDAFAEAVRTGKWLGTHPPGISLALPCGQFSGRYDYMLEMGQLVDLVNVMCYDFSGPFSTISDHHSNLYSRNSKGYSADAGIRELLETGFPARKIVLGIPIYGRGFEGCSNLLSKFTKPSTGTWGDLGVIDYKDLNLRSHNCSPLIELVTNGTYCHDKQLNRIIVYDSVTAVQKKIQYVKNLGLAGVMFWEPSADIYNDQKDNLISAANSAIFPFKLDSTRNNLCYPNSIYSNINSSQNCTYKAGPFPSTNYRRNCLAPVNIEAALKAVPFGARIHRK